MFQNLFTFLLLKYAGSALKSSATQVRVAEITKFMYFSDKRVLHFGRLFSAIFDVFSISFDGFFGY